MITGIVLTRPLAIPQITGLSTTVINGQPMLTYDDPARGEKTLSISEQNHIFSRGRLSNNDWVRIANASHSDNGFVAEFDGCICYASGHCEDTGPRSKDIHVFIDNVDMGSIGTLAGGDNAKFTNTVLNLDYLQGQIIRLQAVDTPASPNGDIQDTVITVTIKHRG